MIIPIVHRQKFPEAFIEVLFKMSPLNFTLFRNKIFINLPREREFLVSTFVELQLL